jgi:hypothetical protein
MASPRVRLCIPRHTQRHQIRVPFVPHGTPSEGRRACPLRTSLDLARLAWPTCSQPHAAVQASPSSGTKHPRIQIWLTRGTKASAASPHDQFDTGIPGAHMITRDRSLPRPGRREQRSCARRVSGSLECCSRAGAADASSPAGVSGTVSVSHGAVHDARGAVHCLFQPRFQPLGGMLGTLSRSSQGGGAGARETLAQRGGDGSCWPCRAVQAPSHARTMHSTAPTLGHVPSLYAPLFVGPHATPSWPCLRRWLSTCTTHVIARASRGNLIRREAISE